MPDVEIFFRIKAEDHRYCLFLTGMGDTAILLGGLGWGKEAQPENFLTEIFLSGSRTFYKMLTSLLKAFLFKNEYVVSNIFNSSL